MVNPYKKQREKIQKSFERLGLIRPLIKDDLPIEITEKKNTKNKLKRLFIQNIPASKDTILPISYELDLELGEPVIGKVEKTRTVEKAILFFTLSSLYIVLIEMKESIQSAGNESSINTIKEKFEHSIARINLLLTSYVFPKRHEGIEIEYFGIVVYNKDNVAEITEGLQQSEIYKILKKQANAIWLTDAFGNQYNFKLVFMQNTSDNKEDVEVDFDDFFEGDVEFENAMYNEELSLPNILK